MPEGQSKLKDNSPQVKMKNVLEEKRTKNEKFKKMNNEASKKSDENLEIMDKQSRKRKREIDEKTEAYLMEYQSSPEDTKQAAFYCFEGTNVRECFFF